ncbi:restriction endonuclease [Streptomyces sp. NPDC049967]|uniref:restriction endonuclease n=1 Tax=Streptomyces sp. NPDC049967 TaxID=3155658 RepID=UPI003413A6B4
MERVISGPTGSARTERVIVPAKHWLKKSVDLPTPAECVAQVKLWEPPLVHNLIIATSGRFTTDAIGWAESHNDAGNVPRIDLWTDNDLERLLAQKPHIVAAFGLR